MVSRINAWQIIRVRARVGIRGAAAPLPAMKKICDFSGQTLMFWATTLIQQYKITRLHDFPGLVN